MRVHYFALAAAILVASSAATSTSTESKLIARRLTDEKSFSSQRLLRTHKTSAAAEEGEEEERVFGINLGFIDDIVHSVQTKILEAVDSTQVMFLLDGMKKKEIRPDDAFKALNVDKVTDNLLASKEFQLLEQYVRLVNQKDPEEALAGALTANLGGPGFSTMTAAAMKNANTKEIATKLEAAQISRWLDNAFSPIKIMDTQQLSKAGAGLFDSPQFATWSSYLTAYNEKYPKKQLTITEAFTKGYGEEGVLKILGSVDDGPGATKFKDEMLKAWMANLDHPANMFKRFKLDEAGDKLLSNPLLSIWTRYMKAFNEQNPFAETTMIQTLIKSYGDEKLATIIQAGTKVDETEQFAKNLQTAQFKRWMTQEKTPEDIFKKVLKLDSTDSPNADIWRAYYTAYEKENPGKLFSFNP